MIKGLALKRALVDGIIDHLRFRLDAWPELHYQPLPWVGIEKAKRDTGVESRWRVIAPVVEERNVRTALDVGCNVGFFPLSLAQMGVEVVGVEQVARPVRLFTYTVRKLGLDNVGVLHWRISPYTVRMLPEADCVLFLSVWHHLTKDYGLEGAEQVLKALWAKTCKVLFFETGEREMTPNYNLPDMGPDPAAYLQSYLEQACVGGKVEHLGLHAAFGPDDEFVKRNLFAVHRV
jgi:hypothetical protein